MSKDPVDDRFWHLTGQYRFQWKGWLKAQAVLQIQEQRRFFRRRYAGHTPANWITLYRWRNATYLEALNHGTKDEWSLGHHANGK